MKGSGKNLLAAALLALMVIGEVSAHPVSYKGGFGIMPEYTADRQDLELNYSFDQRAAVGFSAINARLKEGNRTYVIPRFNYRLYRQNELDSQMNVYLYGGVGAVVDDDQSGIALMSGVQGDYETRRIYTLLAGENVNGEQGVDLTRVRYRFGAAPYLGGFDDLNTWLIGQVEFTPDMDDEWTVTPLLRFFFRNYLVEVGSSTRGDVFVAGIFHF